jgi:predicted DNA-binding transcriptional regulator YafY
MRASRLLRVLLLLQNRGRQTCGQLAAELEVTRRTVLRDVEALTEAGLPVVVTRGAKGGVELGFNYRSRLTGLSQAEAEGLGVLLGAPSVLADSIGLGEAARAARTKLLESLPDGVREAAMLAQQRFRSEVAAPDAVDSRLPALAMAIRQARRVRIRARGAHPRTVHPVALTLGPDGWRLDDALTPGAPVHLDDCDDLNISALTFAKASAARAE